MSVWQERLGIIRGLFHETRWDAAGPLLRLGLRCGGWLLAGAMLSGAQLGGRPLFLAVGLTAACGGGLMGLSALAGTILGSLALWGPLGALEQVAAALLCFCVSFVLRELPVAHSRWLRPVCAAGTALVLGGAAVWAAGPSQTGIALAVLRVALAGLSAAAFRRRGVVSQLFSYGALVLGGAAVHLPLGLCCGGLIAAFWTATAALDRRRAAAGAAALAGGAAMELAGGGPYVLALGLGCLACRAVEGERLVFRAALGLLTAISTTLLFGAPSLPLALELTLGTLLAATVPAQWLRLGQEPAGTRQRQLRLAADGLRALGRCAQQREEDGPGDSAALFDRTAEQACRLCGSFSLCWGTESERTIAALNTLPAALLDRGHVRRDELPEAFAAICRRPEAFAAALNHQLELRLCRRQGSVRLEELRAIQARRTTVIARLLEQLAAPAAPPGCRYRAVMGAAAAARSGEVVSGDAGAYCKGPDGRVYLLVCDGMGTGAEAARLSHAAVDALSALLQAGAAAADALTLLGGTYLLRGDGAFSTVDLAEVDLHSGEAVLYKWGAAPSYLLTADGIKRVGTATLPPGLGADETLSAETVRLSLRRGEMLVLISDGAGGAETERLLGAYDGYAPRELAGRIVQAAQDRAASDDMTAAVIRLERVQ